eukprot:3940916-Rhodomonas_salina.1
MCSSIATYCTAPSLSPSPYAVSGNLLAERERRRPDQMHSWSKVYGSWAKVYWNSACWELNARQPGTGTETRQLEFTERTKVASENRVYDIRKEGLRREEKGGERGGGGRRGRKGEGKALCVSHTDTDTAHTDTATETRPRDSPQHVLALRPSRDRPSRVFLLRFLSFFSSHFRALLLLSSPPASTFSFSSSQCDVPPLLILRLLLLLLSPRSARLPLTCRV